MVLNIDEIYSNEDQSLFHKMSVETTANTYCSIEFIIKNIEEFNNNTNLNLNQTNLTANDLFKFYADTIIKNFNLYKYLYLKALEDKSKFTIYYSSKNLIVEKTNNSGRNEYSIDYLTEVANRYFENLSKKSDTEEAKILKQNLLNLKNKLKEQGQLSDIVGDINFGF